MKDLDVGFGHCYFDIINNEQRIEFHIDYWNRAVASTARRPVEIKATTSIRVSSKARPIMIVGQECTCTVSAGVKDVEWAKRPATPTPEV